jgi:hypothetical protein
MLAIYYHKDLQVDKKLDYLILLEGEDWGQLLEVEG